MKTSSYCLSRQGHEENNKCTALYSSHLLVRISTTKIVQAVALSLEYGTNSTVSKGLLFSHTYTHPCRHTVMVVNTKPGKSPLFQLERCDYSTELRFSIMVIHIYYIDSGYLIQPCITPSISVSCRRWDKHMKRKKSVTIVRKLCWIVTMAKLKNCLTGFHCLNIKITFFMPLYHIVVFLPVTLITLFWICASKQMTQLSLLIWEAHSPGMRLKPDEETTALTLREWNEGCSCCLKERVPVLKISVLISLSSIKAPIYIFTLIFWVYKHSVKSRHASREVTIRVFRTHKHVLYHL